MFTRRAHALVSTKRCPRHEARMLPTANSEQQSTPRSRVYAMSVLRLLSACYFNIVPRVTQRGKHPKQNIGEKQKLTRSAITKYHIWGREGLQAEEKVAPKLSCRLGRRQVSYRRRQVSYRRRQVSYGRDREKGK